MNGEHDNAPPIWDEEYKEATQAVVDDRMRTDVLGPRICAVLETHTPASQAITRIVTESIQRSPEMQKEIKSVIENYNKESMVRKFDRIGGIAIGVVSAVIISIIIWLIQNNFLKK